MSSTVVKREEMRSDLVWWHFTGRIFIRRQITGTLNRACIVQRKDQQLDELTYVRGRRRRGRAARSIHVPLGINVLQAPTVYVARITNAVEGWHHGLQSHFLCHHPTVWTFMRGIQRDIQRQKGLFLQATIGVIHPPSAKTWHMNALKYSFCILLRICCIPRHLHSLH